MKEIPGGNADPTVLLLQGLREAHGTGIYLRWESSRTQVPKILRITPCLASEKTAGRAWLSPTRAAPTEHNPRGQGS